MKPIIGGSLIRITNQFVCIWYHLLSQRFHLLTSIPVEHCNKTLTPQVHHIVCFVNNHFEGVLAALNLNFFTIFQLKSLCSVKTYPSCASIIDWFANCYSSWYRDYQGSERERMWCHRRYTDALSIRLNNRPTCWEVISRWSCWRGQYQSVTN